MDNTVGIVKTLDVGSSGFVVIGTEGYLTWFQREFTNHKHEQLLSHFPFERINKNCLIRQRYTTVN